VNDRREVDFGVEKHNANVHLRKADNQQRICCFHLPHTTSFFQLKQRREGGGAGEVRLLTGREISFQKDETVWHSPPPLSFPLPLSFTISHTQVVVWARRVPQDYSRLASQPAVHAWAPPGRDVLPAELSQYRRIARGLYWHSNGTGTVHGGGDSGSTRRRRLS
jgi:hypothetical protein